MSAGPFARYPINWVVGALLLTVGSVVVGSVLAFLAIIRIVRRSRWPAEWKRRRAQPTTIAHVDTCEAITDEHVRLVLSVEHRTEDGYREPKRVRLLGIALLPAEVVARLGTDAKIPLRFDPQYPAASTIDIAQITGTPAEDAEFESYMHRGPAPWKVL